MTLKRSIKDEGGLQIHLGDQWPLFVRLDDAGLKNTAIGKVLGKSAATIKRWRKLRREERGQEDTSTKTKR